MTAQLYSLHAERLRRRLAPGALLELIDAIAEYVTWLTEFADRIDQATDDLRNAAFGAPAARAQPLALQGTDMAPDLKRALTHIADSILALREQIATGGTTNETEQRLDTAVNNLTALVNAEQTTEQHDVAGVNDSLAALDARIKTLEALPEGSGPFDPSGLQTAIDGLGTRVAALEAAPADPAGLQTSVNDLVARVDVIEKDLADSAAAADDADAELNPPVDPGAAGAAPADPGAGQPPTA